MISIFKGGSVVVIVIILCMLLALAALVLNRQRTNAEAVGCANQLVSLGFVAIFDPQFGSNDRLPKSLSFIKDRGFQKPRILACPSDHSNPMLTAKDWSGIDPDKQSTFEIVAPGLFNDPTNSNAVFMRCKRHGYLLYADDTVFDGIVRRRKSSCIGCSE
jgi:hypothetical protein